MQQRTYTVVCKVAWLGGKLQCDLVVLQQNNVLVTATRRVYPTCSRAPAQIQHGYHCSDHEKCKYCQHKCLLLQPDNQSHMPLNHPSASVRLMCCSVMFAIVVGSKANYIFPVVDANASTDWWKK